MYNLSFNNIANQGFTFFEEKIVELTPAASMRIVAVALFALGCFVALCACISICCDELTDDYNYYDPLDSNSIPYGQSRIIRGSNLFPQEQIVELEAEEIEENPVDLSTLAEEQRVIKALKKNWLDDPAKELQRIADAKLFPPTIQSQIAIPNALDSAIQGVFPTHSLQISQMYAVMGRILEIKNLYRHTHYVFTHGQAPDISVANQIMKELVRSLPLHHPYKTPFRLPHTVAYSNNAEEFVDQYKATSQAYGFDDAAHSDKMLSVDAQFWNTQKMESALDFFSTASNIIRGDGQLLPIFKSIFLNYIPNDAICKMLAEKALKIANQKKAESLVGTLYAICIPKEIIQDEKRNFAYACHPFGRKCDCFPGKDRIELLEAMQINQHVICKAGHFTQYRILTSRLAEEKDVRTFAVNAIPKNKRKIYRDQVKELVKEMRLYSYLSVLIEKLERDPSVIDQISSLIESSPQLDHKYIEELYTVRESGKNKKNGSLNHLGDFDFDVELLDL